MTTKIGTILAVTPQMRNLLITLGAIAVILVLVILLFGGKSPFMRFMNFFLEENGGQGGGSTANFLSGLMKSVPPLNDLFEQAGMSLPEFLGKDMKDALEKSREEAIKRVAEEEAEHLNSNDVEVIEP